MPAEPSRLHDRVSVVLLTYNCGHRLAAILDELLTLEVPIIAVDNASTDDTRAVLRRYPLVELVALHRNVGAAARNVGLARITTPYVALCDDDGWYEREGLKLAADAFDRHPALALVNGRILVTEDEYLDPISAEMADSPLPERSGIPGGVLLGFMGGACIVRARAYLEVGGYDPAFFMGGEEEALALKLAAAGWQLRYRDDVVVHHRPSVANVSALRAHGVRNALWTIWLYRRPYSAVLATATLLVERPKDRNWVRGAAMAIRGARWVARTRRPVPRDIDHALRTLDHHRRRTRPRLLAAVSPTGAAATFSGTALEQ